MGKIRVSIKIRVLFWPEISALGVLFNFDNERMHPPKYPSAPPGPLTQIFAYGKSSASVLITSLTMKMNARIILIGDLYLI